jgi:hypothetical protein
MNEALLLNRTGIFPPELCRCAPEPIEESKETWQIRFRIYEVSTQELETAKGSSEIMGRENTTGEASLDKYSRYSIYSQTESRQRMTNLFPKVAKRLEQFEKLETNWDGEQALPPSSETLIHAYEILETLWQSACTRRSRPPEPRVTCDANGDITYAWTLGEKELELGFSVTNGIPKYEYLICSTSDEPFCVEGPYHGNLTDSPTFGALFRGF